IFFPVILHLSLQYSCFNSVGVPQTWQCRCLGSATGSSRRYLDNYPHPNHSMWYRTGTRMGLLYHSQRPLLGLDLGKIQWLDWSKESFEKARAEGKPI